MSKDIFTIYTKYVNKENGRKGYYNWKNENITIISPKKYGMFLNKKINR